MACLVSSEALLSVRFLLLKLKIKIICRIIMTIMPENISKSIAFLNFVFKVRGEKRTNISKVMNILNKER